jgi:hypothetical protein
MNLPTHRRLHRTDAATGQAVEYLGETKPARRTEHGLSPDVSPPLFSGHPGKVIHDYGGDGRHLVVAWHGLEDTDESNTSSGYEWDETETYLGLGWLDQAEYDERCQRLSSGQTPLN